MKRRKKVSNRSPKYKVNYNRGDGVMEIKITSDTGAKLDVFKANLKDKKAQARIFGVLIQKYDIEFKPEIEPELIQDKEKGFFDY